MEREIVSAFSFTFFFKRAGDPIALLVLIELCIAFFETHASISSEIFRENTLRYLCSLNSLEWNLILKSEN